MQPTRRHLALCEALWLAGCFLLAVIAYWQVLPLFFAFDDLSILSQATPLGGASLVDCWRPLENGFWRPLPLSLAWLAVWLFGPEPLVFHLIPVAFHALNGWLLTRLAAAFGWRDWSARTLGLVFVIHAAAYPTVWMMQNVMDVLFGTGLLLALLGGRAIVDGDNLRLASARLLVVGVLAGLLSKETAAVVPFVALVWFWATRPPTPTAVYERGTRSLPRRAWMILVGLCGLAVLFAALSLLSIRSADAYTYLEDGHLHGSEKIAFHQLCDYAVSTLFPYLHALPGTLTLPEIGQSELWTLRILTFFAIVASAGFCALRRRPLLGLLAATLAVIAPAALLTRNVEPRFYYAAIAPMMMLIGEAIRSLDFVTQRARRLAGCTLAAAASIASVVYLSSSWSLEQYVETVRGVEAYVLASRTEATTWNDGDVIGVLEHPHTGEPLWRWGYCQQLHALFVGGPRVTIIPDPVVGFDALDRLYLFRDGGLHELPIKSLPSPVSAPSLAR